MRDLLLKLLKFRWPLHSLLIIIGFFNSSHPFSLEPWVSPLFVTPTLRIPAFCVRIHHGDFSATHHRNFSTNKHWSVFPFSRWVFYQSPAKYVLFLTEVSLVPKTTEVSSLLITVIFQPVTTNLNVSCAIFTTVIFIPITIPHQSPFHHDEFFLMITTEMCSFSTTMISLPVFIEIHSHLTTMIFLPITNEMCFLLTKVIYLPIVIEMFSILNTVTFLPIATEMCSIFTTEIFRCVFL